MISVIIPTQDRAKLLRETLLSISKQTLHRSNFEVLVIDNGQGADTLDVVSRFQPSFDNLKYFKEPNPGLHEGRHRGVRESHGDILVFADDDIEAFPSWLEGVSESFADDKVGLVGGKNIPNYEADPPAWLYSLWETTEHGRYITYFSLLDFGDQILEIDPHFVFGCNFSIRKNLVLEAKGFHPDGMPPRLIKFRGDGETHLATEVRRLGFKTIYNPKASVKHWVPSSRTNLDYIKKRAFAEGITKSYFDTRQEGFNKKKETAVIAAAKRAKKAIRELFLSDLQKQILASTREGYKFHQEELKKSPELMQWVLREHYMGDSEFAG